MRDSRLDSRNYNALRDAHDIALCEIIPSGSELFFAGITVVLITVFAWVFGKIVMGWGVGDRERNETPFIEGAR